MIKRVDNKEEKICMEILEALPEWFEIPESRVSYAKESKELPFFADVKNDVILLQESLILQWSFAV